MSEHTEADNLPDLPATTSPDLDALAAQIEQNERRAFEAIDAARGGLASKLEGIAEIERRNLNALADPNQGTP
ncbi:MAG: hypothetical protein FWD85_06940 [Microbacteriaceae bacterium]|nr:hypothetical protein [Microbacteriaceae bacterium]MCL2795026.1 hypothetical protein [Microbacteriaceae bacterium]